MITSSSALPFIYASYSIPSEKRPDHNEDSLVLDPAYGLAAVLDGVGGSASGELASQTAAQALQSGWQQLCEQFRRDDALLLSCSDVDPSAQIAALVEEVHWQVRATSAQNIATLAEQGLYREDIATTLALVAICLTEAEPSYTLIHASVGDSRVYRLRDGREIVCLTRDDSYLMQQVRMNILSMELAAHIDQAENIDQLSDDEFAYFNKRHTITQALGDYKPPEVHVAETQLLPGDRILLCTDGIHDNLTDREIETILREAQAEEAAQRLVMSASRISQQDIMRAKRDDMTALVITYPLH